MANALYDKGRESFLKGEISWTSDNIKCVLVDTASYSVDLVNHQFLSDIPAVERVAISANLSGKTSTAGVADADDVLFASVTGDQSEALVLYQDSGVEGSSRLIAYIDTATGLPVTPNSGDVSVTWDNNVTKIFKL